MILPPGENIIETKKCHISGEDFFVTDKDLEFIESVSPVFAGKKQIFPSLEVSPLEMRRTLLGYRNQNRLYKRKCDMTGQEIIAMFAKEAPFPVYEKSYWYGNEWTPMIHAQKMDLEKTFFQQWSELSAKVPRPSCSRHTDVNSVYSNNCASVKDCYLCFNGLYNENCLYCQIWDYSKDCIDCECIYECENSYRLSLSKKCYACHYSHELTNCRDCLLCYDCIGCTDCIGCYNLRNKSHYLFNEPSSPEAIREYQTKHRHSLLSHESLRKVISQGIHKYASTVQSEDCLWNEFQSSKNCFDCYYMMDAEDCAYCDNGKEQNDCRYVMNGMKNLSRSYCSQTVGINGSNLCFTINSTQNISELYYSAYMFFWVSQCFGCIGLHNHEHHCLFNTTYSVQEYGENCTRLVDHMRSTGEWWQFFPRSLSPFEYNESLAQEIFPFTREEAEKQGWKWREEERRTFEGTPLSPLPITEYDERIVWFDIAQKNIDSLLLWTVLCTISRKPFKILRQELLFYLQNDIPIPTKHPDVRHLEMLTLRNPRIIHEARCTACHESIITTYPPESMEKVVCEKCYRKLVY